MERRSRNSERVLLVAARNRINIGTEEAPEYGELAGAVSPPDRRTMFVNVYTSGMTFAITGPWR